MCMLMQKEEKGACRGGGRSPTPPSPLETGLLFLRILLPRTARGLNGWDRHSELHENWRLGRVSAEMGRTD